MSIHGVGSLQDTRFRLSHSQIGEVKADKLLQTGYKRSQDIGFPELQRVIRQRSDLKALNSFGSWVLWIKNLRPHIPSLILGILANQHPDVLSFIRIYHQSRKWMRHRIGFGVRYWDNRNFDQEQTAQCEGDRDWDLWIGSGGLQKKLSWLWSVFGTGRGSYQDCVLSQ